MINRHYSFSYIFHQNTAVEERLKMYQRYAKDYIVRLYRLSEGFAFPELICKEQYDIADFMSANGIVVGDRRRSQNYEEKAVAARTSAFH